jgi:hypothetical protein
LLLIKLNEGNGFYLSVKGMANKLNGSGDGKKYLIIRGVKLKSPAMYAGDLCMQIKAYVQYAQ